jgi:hypothetical protein
MAEAQANARMALMIAIGQLQKTMGPDTRISARAELFAKDGRIGDTSVSTGTPKAWWVGVSSSDPEQSVDSSSGNTIAWLVSGLDSQATPAEQISSSQSFADPVPMFGHMTIDTANLTGGEPIEAGKISVTNGNSSRPGKLAWFIDDNGMKAQLAASNPEVKNNRAVPYGQGILPGTYDLGILEKMDVLAGRTPEEITRLLSTGDLRFIGLNEDIVREKRLSYTTSSRGVLSDVKNGGLKKDLTIAFENDGVFDGIWGSGYDDANEEFNKEYILMDPEKFAQCSDLQENGYIHWDMLKDFYNIKRYIQSSGGMDSIPISVFSIRGLGFTGGIDGRDGPNYRDGRLGPHQIGTATSTNGPIPYGDYAKNEYANNGSAVLEPVEYYKHSPVVPIIQRMQQNAWLERLEKGGEPHVRTNVQIWIAQYNPYNIVLDNQGPYCRGYSPVDFEHKGLRVERKEGGVQEWMTRHYKGLLHRRQITSSAVIMAPGRSHVMALQRDNDNATQNRGGYYSGGTFGENVKDLTMESSFRDYRLFDEQSSPDTLTYSFALGGRAAIVHGGKSNANFNPGNVGNQHWWTV